MNEQTKALVRRRINPAYADRYFVGRGLDIGAGPDPLARTAWAFPNIVGVHSYDKEHGDAQTLDGVPDNCYNFVHASHVLEHLTRPNMSLERWIDVVKPGGHLIITVPDEDMYERHIWPSQFSAEHQWSFTVWKNFDSPDRLPRSINVLDFVLMVKDRCVLERLEVLREHFNPDVATNVDQTLGDAECAIEFVLRKR